MGSHLSGYADQPPTMREQLYREPGPWDPVLGPGADCRRIRGVAVDPVWRDRPWRRMVTDPLGTVPASTGYCKSIDRSRLASEVAPSSATRQHLHDAIMLPCAWQGECDRT
jgi:hypothetical protein